ncbi:MAG: endonuclease [Clostridia bacterium]|nr:endonuclease [Clostridia bacterium]
MKKSSFITRLSILLASVVAIGGITFGVRYEYKEANAWSGNQTSTAPANYYSSCEGKEGSALQSELLSINAPKSTSYDWSRYEACDEAENDSSSIICIYTRHNIKKNSHVGSYSWDTWNREHVWTQTKYPNSKTDNHNIFACEGEINNIRGNYSYAEVVHNSTTQVTVHDHLTDCYFDNSYFEPCDDAKGEIARSVMYGTVMYSYRMTDIAKNIETMLKWHLEHPVSNRDVYRNNTAYKLQGNRNPFVDEPSYACKIWGNTNDATKALCSGGSITPEKTLTSVVVSTVKTSVQVNREIQLTAIAKYSDNTEVDVTSSAIWKSSNDSYAIVASDGTVLGVEVCDEVTITATFQERTGSVKLSVTEKPIIPTEPDKPSEDTPPSNKKGCKGSIISSSIVLTLLSIVGVTLVLFRKKKQH